MADDNGVERVLIVTAHPDDCDFGCAGTTAQWTASGLTVTYCIATDGDAGGSDRSVSRTEMARIRRDEQRAAAAEVGVSEVVFLGYPDGRVTPSLELRRDITRVIRQKQPQRVVAQSPVRAALCACCVSVHAHSDQRASARPGPLLGCDHKFARLGDERGCTAVRACARYSSEHHLAACRPGR